MSLTTSGERIRIVEGDYGAIVFGSEEDVLGFAAPKNESGTWCVDTMTGYLNGECTTTAPKRAAEGRVFVNLYYASLLDFDEKQWLISHEIGHLIGLKHSGECSASVMRENVSCNTVSELESGLISAINSKYP